MKKLLTFALCLVLALCALSFVACDDGDTPPTTDVTYKFYSLTMQPTGGDATTLNIGDPAPWSQGNETLTADSVIVVFKQDGTYVSTNIIDGVTQTMNGTWTKDGDVYTFTQGGQSATGSIVDDTLTQIYSHAGEMTITYVYKKV
ncbi:MAG: hypothetical protein J6V68_03285 [Clostridia bacterium]|nr:hypothetical protein [Clostridia bacterium]